MVRPTSWARGPALCAAMLFLWGADNISAAPHPHRAPPHVPKPCMPRAATFGHYEGYWRQWAVEQRPDQTFPQSIGAEPLPTPQAEKLVPLPVEVVPPLQPPQGTEPATGAPRLPTELPQGLPGPETTPPPGPETTPPAEGPGEILPPGTKIRIDGRSPLEPPPPSPSPLEPPQGEMLPESPPAKTTPKLPLETPAEKTTPKLPLETPPAKTTPKLPLETPPLDKLPLEPPAPPKKSLPAETPRPAPSKSGRASGHGELPMGFDLPARRRSVETPPPKDGGRANLFDARPPEVQENVPVPVEPWARPRPWRPEPSRQADYRAPVELRPATRPSRRPLLEFPPERMAEPRVKRPLPAEPRVKRPLPAEPSVERPVAARFERPIEPSFERPASPRTEAARRPPGLDGYCPVRLAQSEQWVAGDPRWAVSYRGTTYLTSGPEPQRLFLANPSRYAPALAGQDPVLTVDEKTEVPGRTEFCVVYDGRLYMFSSAATLARFHQNPKHYSGLVLARTP